MQFASGNISTGRVTPGRIGEPPFRPSPVLMAAIAQLLIHYARSHPPARSIDPGFHSTPWPQTLPHQAAPIDPWWAGNWNPAGGFTSSGVAPDPRWY